MCGGLELFQRGSPDQDRGGVCTVPFFYNVSAFRQHVCHACPFADASVAMLAHLSMPCLHVLPMFRRHALTCVVMC